VRQGGYNDTLFFSGTHEFPSLIIPKAFITLCVLAGYYFVHLMQHVQKQ
jgi:hypothetical protein